MRRLAVTACAAVLCTAALPAAAGIPAIPIPQGTSASSAVPFIGSPATPNPVASPAVPAHPYMAPNGRSNIHVDAYMTDANEWAGPLGVNMEVRSTFHVAECASHTFDYAGRLITVCIGLEGPRLVMIDPGTLETLAVLPLPPRRTQSSNLFNDVSGGGYFYLDNLDRAVIPTTIRQIWVVAENVGVPGFALDRTYDVSGAMGIDDGIVSALPDWSGLLWFVTAKGVVGTVEPGSGAVRSMHLAPGEVIGNSFAVDETRGVYVVSSVTGTPNQGAALYRFDAAPDGAPSVTWREPYDVGVRFKPGQLNWGSGTTPTLFGDGLVAITDNADPRMNVLVFRRAAVVSGPRLVCSEPVFADGLGATDNSLIAVGDSLVVENNYGYSGPAATFRGGVTEPGIARVDVDVAAGDCSTAWTSGERAPSVVPKASLATGLVYTYTKPPQANGTDTWYFTAIDFRTGATAFKRLAGTDLGFNNNWAPLTLGPDGTAYVGVLGGLVALRDGAP